jgi:ribonuclease D
MTDAGERGVAGKGVRPPSLKGSDPVSHSEPQIAESRFQNHEGCGRAKAELRHSEIGPSTSLGALSLSKGNRQSAVCREPGPAHLSGRSFPATISKDEVNRLPIGRYTGPVHLIASDDAAARALAALAREKVLGFDTETRAAFRVGESYPPALVQLAAEREVFIFRLAALRSLAGLFGLLANGRVVKAGISLAYDLKKLRELHEFAPAGFVELEKLTDRHGIAANGLRGMAAIVLGLRISKSAKCSNWSHPRLTHEQICYAATDAWACREIYVRLVGSPEPRLPAHPRRP